MGVHTDCGQIEWQNLYIMKARNQTKIKNYKK